MKPKKIAVMYDCGRDEIRGLETRISILNDPTRNDRDAQCIAAFTLNSDGETTSYVCLELTDEVVKEINEILSEQ